MIIGGKHAIAPELVVHGFWQFNPETNYYVIFIQLATGGQLTWSLEKKADVDKVMKEIEECIVCGEEARREAAIFMDDDDD